MTDDDRWVCQCRKCLGVKSADDAVQYVWEYCFGACEVPIVATVHVGFEHRAYMTLPCWHGEPATVDTSTADELYVVSFRPGGGTSPTEGDVARWVEWDRTGAPPTDWLVADGTRFRSVRDTVEALRKNEPPPNERMIPGDWHPVSQDESEFRERYARDWNEIVERNQNRRRSDAAGGGPTS